MNRHWWRKRLLSWMALLLALFLMMAGPFPVNADGGPGVADVFLDTATSLPDMEAPEDKSFDEFESFEEFDEGSGETAFDPLSGYNRVMTQVNDRLYYWVLKPVASGYKAVMPEPVRVSIGHFFRNLAFPARLVNNLLQLKLKQAGTETLRFVVNTTIGVAGLRDPATTMLEMPVYEEDFGQTLGHYGLGGGFHIVLPLFGPSNARDTCGKVADWFLDPVHYIEDSEAKAAVNAVRVVNGTSLRIGQYEAMTKDSLDLYVLLRDAYESNRDKNIKE
jgi:phospholipid-binding lipoprotein MlaA